jgi:hypothetical protein
MMLHLDAFALKAFSTDDGLTVGQLSERAVLHIAPA